MTTESNLKTDGAGKSDTLIVVGPDGERYELPTALAAKFEVPSGYPKGAEHLPGTAAVPASSEDSVEVCPVDLRGPDMPAKQSEPECLSLAANLCLLWSFRRFFLPFLLPAAALLGFALVQGDLQLTAALYQQRLLDSLIGPTATPAPNAEEPLPPESAASDGDGSLAVLARILPTVSTTDTIGLTLWLSVLLIAGIGFAIISEQASVILNQKFRHRVQAAILDGLSRERKECRSKRQSGASASIMRSDSGGLSGLLVFGILGFLENLVKTVIYAVGIFLLPGGWVLLAVMLPLSFLFQGGVLAAFHRREAAATERSETLRVALDSRMGRFFEMLGRFVTFGTEARLSQSVLDEGLQSAEANRVFQLVSSLRSAVSGLLLTLSMPLTVLLIVSTAGPAEISPGTVVQANSLVALLVAGIGTLMMTPATLTHYGPSMRRVRALLDIPETGEEPPELKTAERWEAPLGITLEELRFRFAGTSQDVIKSIDLSIPGGATVGIVGASGCGKSTLAALLQGDLLPTAGRIMFGEWDVTRWDLKWKRRLVGFMPTAFEFLAASVRDNILLGRTQDEAPGFQRAVEVTGVLDFLRKTTPPRDLDYMIESFTGEGSLSSGQKRRVGLAQALAGPQPILILDEPGANLNPGDMTRLAEALPAALEGRTTLVITHDPDVFHTDFNVFILDGTIAAVGPHTQLMAENEEYLKVVGRFATERDSRSSGPPNASGIGTAPADPPPQPGSKESYRRQAIAKG